MDAALPAPADLDAASPGSVCVAAVWDEKKAPGAHRAAGRNQLVLVLEP
jgi:hypothetical protein